MSEIISAQRREEGVVVSVQAEKGISPKRPRAAATSRPQCTDMCRIGLECNHSIHDTDNRRRSTVLGHLTAVGTMSCLLDPMINHGNRRGCDISCIRPSSHSWESFSIHVL